MSTGPEPGGASLRRDNGLVPERWSALAALDPAAGDAVLAALAGRGVPGLVESRRRPADAPGAADADLPPPGSRHDLLWVDASLRDEAAALLVADFAEVVTVLPADPEDRDQPGAAPAAATGAGPAVPRPGTAGPTGRAPLDEDAAWAQIVAGWDRDDAGGPVPVWPVDEDVATPAAPPSPAPSRAGEPDPAHAAPAAGPRDHVPAEDPAEDHYVPPPPPPLPRLRRNTVAALLVLALGVVLLFAPRLVGLREGDAVAVTGIACIVGSVVVLVHGMRDRSAGGNGWDDGAVV